ncbi:LysR family transcriptional regulator, partial [Pseudomonas aeruginosa]|uniref:LysR family transcriptional regulator n=1 Tax=Pseudomonas aeruginosa TaxID=287 RepID=UPI001179DC31
MSPKQLSYFLRISELGSFSKAAAVLYIAQPALSRQIKHLEEELGVKLFERSDAGIYLTAAGRLLSDRAKALLTQIESVRNEISTMALRMQGNIALGVPPSFFGLVTTRLVEELRNQYPDVRLTVVEGISSTLHELLLGGQLDLAIV